MRILTFLLLAAASAAQAADAWVAPGPDGRPQVQLYFYWSLTCPHCTDAHPHIAALPAERPWLRLHELEVSRNAGHARRFKAAVAQAGAQEQAGVPAFLFCGELHFGWDSPDGIGALLKQRLDACHARVLAGEPAAAGILLVGYVFNALL